jgi:thermitase
MLFTGFLTVSAFLLLGLGATRPARGALFMTGGALLVVVSAALHASYYAGFWPLLGQVSAEIGIGSLLLAGLLRRAKRDARSWFGIGAGALLVTVLVFGGQRLLTADHSGPAEGVFESWLVELGEDDRIDEVTPILEAHGARWEQAFPTLSLVDDADLAQTWLLQVPASRAQDLATAMRADTENVDVVELNFEVHLEEPVVAGSSASPVNGLEENDPLAGEQWALDAIRGHEVHRMVMDMQPVRKARVAILDTGVDAAHEDVSSIFASSPATVDQHGHGSHCAGIAGAATNNGLGIASLNWEGRFIDIAGYQALNEQGFGSIEMIAQAIVDATQDGVDVISMSLGARAETPNVIKDAIGFARRKGIIVVASAGNANEDAKDHMPSNVEGVIVVSAVDSNLRKAKFSNTNTSLARPIAAPGVDILSLKTGGGYVTMSGTSMSTPVVSGIIGMMRALDPDIDEETVWSILASTARTIPDSRRIGNLVDAEAALTQVLERR